VSVVVLDPVQGDVKFTYELLSQPRRRHIGMEVDRNAFRLTGQEPGQIVNDPPQSGHSFRRIQVPDVG
jgi:hypothetical protein